MANKVISINEKLELVAGGLSMDSIEGCINCEFKEYQAGVGNYCSEHEKYVKDDDPPCKAYVEQGSY